jgi:hypothetical protein
LNKQERDERLGILDFPGRQEPPDLGPPGLVDLQEFVRLAGGGDRLKFPSHEEMDLLVREPGCGQDGEQRLDVSGGDTGFFLQFPKGALLWGLARIEAAGRDFPTGG